MLRKVGLRKMVVPGEIGYNQTIRREEPVMKTNCSREDKILVGIPMQAEKLTDVAKLLEKY